MYLVWKFPPSPGRPFSDEAGTGTGTGAGFPDGADVGRSLDPPAIDELATVLVTGALLLGAVVTTGAEGRRKCP